MVIGPCLELSGTKRHGPSYTGDDDNICRSLFWGAFAKLRKLSARLHGNPTGTVHEDVFKRNVSDKRFRGKTYFVLKNFLFSRKSCRS